MRIGENVHLVGALRNGRTGCGGAIVISAAFDGSMGAKAGNIGYEEEKAPTLKAGGVYEVVIEYEDRKEPVLP